MNSRRLIAIVLIFLTASVLPIIPIQTGVHAQAPARLEVWSPVVHSSNITDPGLTAGPLLFPAASQFDVRVNLTYTGRINFFDITLHYNLTTGPNVLQAVFTGSELVGGLIDPSHDYGSGCTAGGGAHVDGSQPGNIRVSGEFVGVTCPYPIGTGILFTLTFKVMGIGAGSIEIDDGTGNGTYGTQIIGFDPSQGSFDVPHVAFSAYFRNKAGIPPIAAFAVQPPNPKVGQKVILNATASYDPDNPSAPNHGIEAEPVVYDANGDNQFGGSDILLLGDRPTIGTSLKSDSSLLFIDSNGNHVWDQGESVIYDSAGALNFRAIDITINGTIPAVFTALASDPGLKYVEVHQNHIWDNGYLWDFGDGTAVIPGVIASHIFTAAGSVPSAGVFQVKLVVFDSDDNLAMRQITPVAIKFGIIHRVVLTLTPSSLRLNVGDPLSVNVRLDNRGNRNETVSVNTNYTLHGSTTIGAESGLFLTITGSSSSYNKTYPLQTSSLAPGSYTIISQATLVNATTGAVIPYTDPSDSFARATFIINSTPPNTFLSLPLLAGGGLAVIAAISAAVYLVRRRRKEET